jgi:hypothetical protein
MNSSKTRRVKHMRTMYVSGRKLTDLFYNDGSVLYQTIYYGNKLVTNKKLVKIIEDNLNHKVDLYTTQGKIQKLVDSGDISLAEALDAVSVID